MIINKEVMRDNNERSVLQAIINFGPISRNELSQRLGLNKVSVSDIVGSFVERGLVTSIGEAKSTSTSGRKPELLKFNSNYGYVVNFCISGDSLEMLVTKLDGRNIKYSVNKFDNHTIKEIITKMDELIDQLPDFDTVNNLQAISIAIFGIVYRGEIISSPFVEFDDFDLTGHFQQRYEVPVILENEANLAAVFEQDFSQQELQNIITISIHEGIGAGIIVNTQLYTGYYGQAGEIGRLILHSQNQQQFPRLDKMTNFNDECSQQQILQKAANLKGQKKYSLAELVKDYNEDDPEITDLIDDFCYHLAIVTSDLIAMYDPQMIFFNSPLIDELPEILKKVQMKLSFLKLVPPLVMSKDVKFATLLGGASLAIHKVLHMQGTRLVFHH